MMPTNTTSAPNILDSKLGAAGPSLLIATSARDGLENLDLFSVVSEASDGVADIDDAINAGVGWMAPIHHLG